jgi:hypothetical protein
VNISAAHDAARAAAARLPALQASFALLDSGAGQASIAFYSGAEPAGDLLATLTLGDGAGTVDTTNFLINLSTPVEGQVDASGTATWAKILTSEGAEWGTVTVSDDAGSGEIKLATVDLVAGAFVRLTSGVIQG